jgi:hypothetical protein
MNEYGTRLQKFTFVLASYDYQALSTIRSLAAMPSLTFLALPTEAL